VDRVDKIAEEFDRTVPFSDDAFMVLRMHLLMERELRVYIKWRIEDEKFFNELDAQISGQTLILVAQALSLRDEYSPIAPLAIEGFWGALKILNKMRNMLTHQLSPDDEAIEKQMVIFIQRASSTLGTAFSGEENLKQQFHKAAKYLIAMLVNDRYPITSDGRFSEMIQEGRDPIE
jgi:hypothetical protein